MSDMPNNPFDHDYDYDIGYDYDYVIVGSGVAGALIAKELSRAKFSVCLLETGARTDRKQALQRYRQAVTRDLASPFPRWPWAPIPDAGNAEAYFGKDSTPDYRPSYLKLVGGTTWHWTGMTPRFLPVDFELHSRYGIGMDWPIDYAALEPYYLKAENALGVSGDSDDDHGSPRSGRYPMLPIPMSYSDSVVAERMEKLGIQVKSFPAARNSQTYNKRAQCRGNNTCSPLCPNGAQYSADTDVDNALRLGARLIEQATVYRLECGTDNRIVAARYKLPDGSDHRVTATRFVVACNTIESPRLLLMSACEQAPQGVANSSGQVGRNLMDHVIFFNTFRMDVPLYGGRGPQSVSGLMTGRDGAFRSQYAAAKLFLSNDINVHGKVLKIIEDQQAWSDVHNLLRNDVIHHGCIGGELETLPSSRNRVVLDQDRLDPLGLPLPHLEYQLDNYVHDGLTQWTGFVKELIEKMGAKQTSSDILHSSHHQCGTLRMGNDPKTSVVDRNCRTHDHANLYVMGSSVFPAIGTANPTLTVAALSLRLAEHLTSLGKTS
ncbi:MAG: GMC family oxidoreductase [Gallionella sp.]|nr:GMC family oxidoreductase [Gallionella sp.]MDD4945725.1 GMC family oxidoreductase [Gallionella sp.]